MYNAALHQQVNQLLQHNNIDIGGKDNLFYTRFIANATAIHFLYNELYKSHPENETGYLRLLQSIINAYTNRGSDLKQKDLDKEEKINWYLSNDITGMSLYVDRFCGKITDLSGKLDYFKKLGVNLLHLMPVMESPAGESDGGYAVSDFRKVDARFGTINDLAALQQKMNRENMYLMLDIVLNHTSHKHAWAEKAKQNGIQVELRPGEWVLRRASVAEELGGFVTGLLAEAQADGYELEESSNEVFLKRPLRGILGLHTEKYPQRETATDTAANNGGE